MRNSGGVLIASDPDGGVREQDTFTCVHCQKVSGVQPMQKPEEIGGLCKQCMGLICASCAGEGTCRPWEEQMDEREAKANALRSYGL